MAELEGRSLSIFVVTIVFLALSFISVCLRCFVRLRLVRAFGWDDALMVFAMALNILFALCGITGACYGLGHKLLELTEHEKKTAMFVCFLPRTWFSLPPGLGV
jgi:cation-transporting ATPase 13A1